MLQCRNKSCSTLIAFDFTRTQPNLALADFKVASKWSSDHFFFLQPNFAEILGVPESKASLLIGYLSIASTLSRVLFGLVLNHPRVNRFYVLQVCKEMFSLTNM